MAAPMAEGIPTIEQEFPEFYTGLENKHEALTLPDFLADEFQMAGFGSMTPPRSPEEQGEAEQCMLGFDDPALKFESMEAPDLGVFLDADPLAAWPAAPVDAHLDAIVEPIASASAAPHIPMIGAAGHRFPTAPLGGGYDAAQFSSSESDPQQPAAKRPRVRRPPAPRAPKPTSTSASSTIPAAIATPTLSSSSPLVAHLTAPALSPPRSPGSSDGGFASSSRGASSSPEPGAKAGDGKAGESGGEEDLAAAQQRRFIRMMKNRESASLSRKRKKDYMDGLEARLKQRDAEHVALTARVAALQTENDALRTELARARDLLRATGQGFLASTPAKAAAGATSLFLVVLCVGLFTMGTPSLPRAPSALVPLAPMHGRTLKAAAPPVAGLLDDASRTRPAPSELQAAAPVVVPPREIARTNADERHLDLVLTPHLEELLARANLTKSTLARRHADSTSTGVATLGADTWEVDTFVPSFMRIEADQLRAVMRAVERRPDTSYLICTEAQVFAATKPVDERRMTVITPIAMAAEPSGENRTAPVVQVDCLIKQTTVITSDLARGDLH